MPNDLQTILAQGMQGNAGAAANSNGVVGASTSPANRGETPKDPLLEALTQRLLQQGQGISSSSSSNLQTSINDAIANSKAAGGLGSQALQSEREREVAFARDRAGATYTTALEGRSGYATQVAGLRELTETTEKSVRDLDKRYQEAILANDAATAQRVADMQIKKQEFLMQQEQNFFSNIMSAATLQQNALAQEKQSEQFWAKQDADREQFVMSMAQSDYQFQKNLGISMREIGLKEQGLELERQRNAISLAEFNLKKSELNKEKDTSALKGMIFDKLVKERNNRGGAKLGREEAFDIATAAMGALAQTGVRVDLDMTEMTDLLEGTFSAVNDQALTSNAGGYGDFTDTNAGGSSNGGFFSGLTAIMSESLKPLSERDPKFQTGSIIPNTKASWAIR